MGRGSSVPSHYLRSSRSLSPPPRSLLYLPVYLSLSVLNLFFCSWAELVVVSRGDNIWWYAGLELITSMNLFIFMCELLLVTIVLDFVGMFCFYVHWSSDKLQILMIQVVGV